MLDEASRSGADYRLHYAGRSRAARALVDDLERLHPGRVQVYARDEGSRRDIPAVVASRGPRAQYVCCGPERMIEAMEAAASSLALHVERFAAAPAENGPVGQFVAELAASGTEVVVAPGCSLLDAIEGAGVWVLSSCNDGVCGTCETRVLSGNVDHRDSILTPAQRAANDVMYICVLRGDGRLVLDL